MGWATLVALMATTWSGDTLGPYWTATMATHRVDELTCS
jgi:hypothetical protein